MLLGVPVLLGAPSVPATAAAGAARETCEGRGPCVVIRVVTPDDAVGARTELSAADVDAASDLDDPRFQTRSTPQDEPSNEPQPAEATSLRTLVSMVTDADAVAYTEVVDRDGVGHPLRRGELGPQGENGFTSLMPAVFGNGGNGDGPDSLVYIRPFRGPDDANAGPGPDYGFFPTSSGGALEIIVHTSGAALVPTIVATEVDAEQRRWRFEATFAEPPPSGTTYVWTLGDGTTSTASSPTHRYATEVGDTVTVRLRVEAPDTSRGERTRVVNIGAVPDDDGDGDGDGNGNGDGNGDGDGDGHHDDQGNDDETDQGDDDDQNGTVASDDDDGTDTDAPGDGDTGDGAGEAPSPDAPTTPGPDPRGAPRDEDETPAQDDPVPPPERGDLTGVLLTGSTVPFEPPSPPPDTGATAESPEAQVAAPRGGDAVDPLLWAAALLPLLLLAGAAAESGLLTRLTVLARRTARSKTTRG